MLVPARLLTAIVVGPVVLYSAAVGGVWFKGLILVTAGLAAWELWSLLRGTRYAANVALVFLGRSEERRVGKECRL